MTSMVHLFRVIVPVSDIEKAAVFFGKLLGDPGQRVSPGRHYFDCEGTILACYDAKADGDHGETRPLPEPIYLAVDEIEAVYEKAGVAGASFPSEVVPDVGPLGQIAQRPWGERSFYMEDPFGNRICIVSRDSVFIGS